MQVKPAIDNQDLVGQAYNLFCTYRTRPWTLDTFKKSILTPFSSLLLVNNEVKAYTLVSNITDTLELEDICVAEQMRRTGSASKLLSQLFAQAKAKNMASILLEVSANNIPALALYKRHGFIEQGVRKNYYRLSDGTCADAILMQKSVNLGN